MMDMKTFFSILSALVLVTLFGCTNDEIAGNNTSVNPKDAGAIAFSGGSSMITRTTSYGATAADKLGNTFVVYGTKHVTAEDNESIAQFSCCRRTIGGGTGNHTASATEGNSSSAFRIYGSVVSHNLVICAAKKRHKDKR